MCLFLGKISKVLWVLNGSWRLEPNHIILDGRKGKQAPHLLVEGKKMPPRNLSKDEKVSSWSAFLTETSSQMKSFSKATEICGESLGAAVRARDRVDRAVSLSAVLMDTPLLNLPVQGRFRRCESLLSTFKLSRCKADLCKLYSLKRKEINVILKHLVRSSEVWAKPWTLSRMGNKPQVSWKLISTKRQLFDSCCFRHFLWRHFHSYLVRPIGITLVHLRK